MAARPPACPESRPGAADPRSCRGPVPPAAPGQSASAGAACLYTHLLKCGRTKPAGRPPPAGYLASPVPCRQRSAPRPEPLPCLSDSCRPAGRIGPDSPQESSPGIHLTLVTRLSLLSFGFSFLPIRRRRKEKGLYFLKTFPDGNKSPSFKFRRSRRRKSFPSDRLKIFMERNRFSLDKSRYLC